MYVRAFEDEKRGVTGAEDSGGGGRRLGMLLLFVELPSGAGVNSDGEGPLARGRTDMER